MNNLKTAIITGAASGIGKATALLFSAEGYSLVLSDINESDGKILQDSINEQGGDAIFKKADVGIREEVNDLVTACLSKYGRLDAMINNAGIGLEMCFFEQITDKHWDKIIRVNQTGVFYGMQAALTQMRKQRAGAIVNISSLAGIGAAPRMGAYAASKHAVIGMTKTAASEYGKFNIRVNAVCPTVIETPMGEGYMEGNKSILEMIKHSIPMKRFGKAEEVANTILWLCSDQASYINGEDIRVDGGMRT